MTKYSLAATIAVAILLTSCSKIAPNFTTVSAVKIGGTTSATPEMLDEINTFLSDHHSGWTTTGHTSYLPTKQISLKTSSGETFSLGVGSFGNQSKVAYLFSPETHQIKRLNQR